MNSALKPVMTGPQPAGQASPAKANVANVNHTVGHPQGAQNSLNHGTNNMVGQNLSQHSAANMPQPHHAIPSMAPVSANMAQMAQNMSHHGNLSQATTNSVAAPAISVPVPSPTKPPVAPPTGAPLSLVQDKPPTPNATPTSLPLALTRTPEKKEGESSQSNGTIESPKTGSSAPVTLKPQNPETNKEKQDIAKTSPSTPKPPEKAPSVPSTPQKAESNTQAEVPSEPKVATANEVPEKSPAKPTEMKPVQPADVAPAQSENKPEAAKEIQEKAVTPQKAEPAPSPVKADSPKVEPKKEEPKVELKTADIPDGKVAEKPADKPESIEKPVETKSVPVVEPGKNEEPIKKEEPKKVESIQNKEPEPKPEAAKTEPPKQETKEIKTPAKVEKPAVKSNLKLATVTPPMRKRRSQAADIKASEGPSSSKKVAEDESTPDNKSKRNRTKVQLYQSPTPELAMATKLSASAGRSTPTKPNDDKLIVFYKNEYLAVRNAEGGFYVCQATQNVYRTTRKIKIRWLSQDKAADPSGETYKPDFYDVTDMECVLTTLSLARAPGGGGAQILKPVEAARAQSILNRALQAEQGGENLQLTEEHPDGLDLSLYKDESQLEKKSRKRSSRKSDPEMAIEAAKGSPPASKKARGIGAGSTPPASKTATAVSEKPKKEPALVTPTKKTPAKGKQEAAKKQDTAARKQDTPAKKQDTPAKKLEANAKKQEPAAKKQETPAKKQETPAAKKQTVAAKKQETPVKTPTRSVGRRESKPSPIVPTPSTSTGKSTRTPRKPPAKK